MNLIKLMCIGDGLVFQTPLVGRRVDRIHSRRKQVSYGIRWVWGDENGATDRSECVPETRKRIRYRRRMGLEERGKGRIIRTDNNSPEKL